MISLAGDGGSPGRPGQAKRRAMMCSAGRAAAGALGTGARHRAV